MLGPLGGGSFMVRSDEFCLLGFTLLFYSFQELTIINARVFIYYVIIFINTFLKSRILTNTNSLTQHKKIYIMHQRNKMIKLDRIKDDFMKRKKKISIPWTKHGEKHCYGGVTVSEERKCDNEMTSQQVLRR